VLGSLRRLVSHDGAMNYRLNKDRVPFDKTPLTYETVDYERIALNKFFCRLACRENSHRAFWRITKRAGSENESASVELIESRTMRRIVNHDF
jgi:hypothetical protein